MTAVVVRDGEIVPPDAAHVSVFDRGFLYGDSVYEVVRTYGGRPFALGEHLDRLERSAAMIGMSLPIPKRMFAEEVRLGLDAAGNAESYVRIVVTRGGGPVGLDPALAVGALRVVLVLPLPVQAAANYGSGVAVAIVRPGPRAGLLPVSDAGTAKTGNYLPNVLALRDAKARGAYEAFLVDADGRVLEGSSSNVFCVKAERIRTPPPSIGILEGITRRHVIRVARARGHEVLEGDVRVLDLFSADEVFLTSSLREVVPVTRIDDQPVGEGTPGKMAKELLAAFRESAAREAARQ